MPLETNAIIINQHNYDSIVGQRLSSFARRVISCQVYGAYAPTYINLEDLDGDISLVADTIDHRF